jgi:GR25 family glycosyltransferase involved in LPS biosynthesis
MDCIYWINLDRSKNRFAHMTRILKDPVFNVPTHRIKAYETKNALKHFVLKPDILSVNYRVTDKEYACLLSHLEAIRAFSNSPYETALIFEDDVSIDYKPYWNTTLQSVVQNAPPDWEVLKLSTNLMYPNLYTLWEINCKQRCFANWNAIAYIINKKAALSLMKLYDGKYHLDNSYFHVADYLLFTKLTTYVYKYSFFLPRNNNDTNIQSDKNALHNNKTVQQFKRRMIALYKKTKKNK